MSARQQHGFDYEKHIIELLNLKRNKNYTGKNDAYYKDKNGKEYLVQIKCIKKGSAIDLGDYCRNKNKNKDFVLIIGFWEGSKENIVEEYILYPPLEWWIGLFKVYDGFDKEMYEFLDDISNDKIDDAKWVSGRKMLTKKWNDSWVPHNSDFENVWKEKYPERLVLPRFKRDHKKQKRIQCAIPNKIFYKYFTIW